MKSITRWIIAATAAAASVLMASGPAFAATSLSSNSLTLSVASVSASSDNLILTAQEASGDVGQNVTFFVQTTEFSGDGWMAVGTAAVGSSGKAVYTYTPTWTGSTQFGAVAGSDGSVSVPSVTQTFQVLRDPTGVPQSAIEYARPLGTTGGWLVKGLLTVIAIVWILILGSLVLVVVRVPRLARAGAPDDKGGR